jgi:N-acetylneuraminic acid mutarotase
MREVRHKKIINKRYHVESNTWFLIGSTVVKRYATSASAFANLNKIFLFGGRSNVNNMMVDEIEEYSVSTDSWKVVELKNPSLWIPVEICASTQLDEKRVLVFGGSDAQITDSDFCYCYDVEEQSIQRIDNLKKAQVFVCLPFSYGDNIYAVGNEYYVKNRSFHRFNRKDMTWDLIF